MIRDFIPDPEFYPGSRILSRIPKQDFFHAGSNGQKSTGSRIRSTFLRFSNEMCILLTETLP